MSNSLLLILLGPFVAYLIHAFTKQDQPLEDREDHDKEKPKMYELTLTQEERKALDWVGHRYAHGDELRDLLIEECTQKGCAEDDEEWWQSKADITFIIPEHVAWSINMIGDQSMFLWDCFSDELTEKLNKFCEEIV